jgi:hypothetical protein
MIMIMITSIEDGGLVLFGRSCSARVIRVKPRAAIRKNDVRGSRRLVSQVESWSDRMNADLKEFIRRALEKQAKREEIAQALRQAGWAEPDIAAALDIYAETPFVTPVPKPKPYLSAREVFVYLVMFIALYKTVYDVGALGFNYVTHLFPDPSLDVSFNFSDEIRWRISSLVVVFPLFLYTFRLIEKAIAADPGQRESRPRKWLTYLTLLIATVTLVCDVSYLVYNALGGELSIRIALKASIVAILAGGNFFYFLMQMRQGERV